MPHTDLVVGGKKWPSVTEVLKVINRQWRWEWFERAVKNNGWRGWQKCVATENRGARIGSDVHAQIHNYFVHETRVINLHPRYYAKIRSLADCVWTQFVQPNKVNPRGLEKKVISKVHRYGGTLDAVFSFGESPIFWLIDWKTSNKKWDGKKDCMWPIQLSAYAHAWNEDHSESEHIQHGGIVRIDKQAKVPYIEVTQYNNLENYFPLFQSAKMWWDYLYQNGEIK